MRKGRKSEGGRAKPVREKFLPFCLPTIGRSEKSEVISVLSSGWLTAGSVTERFEAELARYLGAKHVVAVSSCTAALHLSLLALGIGEGDEVIVPSLTFCSTANVVVHCGATPVFADVDETTLTITPEEVDRRAGPRTKAVVAVHYSGYPCDMDGILDVAQKRGLAVVEDAAHALGAMYKNKMIGTFGDATCFSFYPTKTITTGEGGAVSTGDGALAERVKLLSLHGITRDAWKRYTSSASWQYEVTVPGYKYNTTDLEAAIGLRQLERIEEFIGKREKLWKKYCEELSDLQEIELPPSPAEGRHSRHLFVVRLRKDCRVGRDELIGRLREENVGTSVHFLPVHLQPYYRARWPHVSLPVTETVWRRILSLPLYPLMSEGDVEDVCRALRKCLRG